MKTMFRLFFFVLSLSLVSCGGGGYASGGSSGTGISSGSITGFGSIFVNGVEFETNSSSFTIDGQSGLSQSDLREGMVVTVQGTINGSTGTAASVVAEDIIEGPVDNIIGNNTLIVMGQTVLVDDTTIYDNNVPNFAGIALTNILEISGYVRGDGVIMASYIQKKTTADPYEIKGFVKNHNSGMNLFEIGNLTVNYATAITGNMPDPNTYSWNNLLVKVKGNNLTAGTLTATQVEPEGLGLNNADKAELEGFVTSIINATSFVLGNQNVAFSSSTVFEGGVPDDIAVGVKLEVDGPLSSGVINATKISFRDNIRLEADAASVNIGNNELTLNGLPGITIVVDDLTEWKGGYTGIGDITNSDHLRIRGRERNGNVVIATEVEDRGGSDVRVIVQAPVDSFAAPNITLLGEILDTSTITEANFKDVDDSVLGSVNFFANLSNGRLVKAGGDLTMGGIILDQIEYED